MHCFTLGCLLLLVAVCAGAPADKYENFEDFRLYKVYLKDAQQLKSFQQVETKVYLQLLNDIGPNGGNYDVVIAPKDRLIFEESLRARDLEFKCIVKNLREALDGRTVAESTGEITARTASAMEWSKYHSVKDIHDWIDDMAALYPTIVTNYTFGYSYEGRPMKAMKISCKEDNKAVFMESNIHAIEWISSAAGTWFFNNMLASSDPELVRIRSEYDWIYIPVVNPDGLEYSKTNPLWRKNRKPTGFSNIFGECYGIDMNRNFDYHFKEAGRDVDVPCNHFYAGSQPDSEAEVQAVQKFFNSFPSGYIRMYLAVHSFGQFLLLPYGHTNEVFPPNYDQMMRISKGFADAAAIKNGTVYTYGASGLLMSPVSGSAKDWAYGIKNIPYSATLELPDTGTYGFFLPASKIVSVGEEMSDGLIGLLNAGEVEDLFD